ncbi:polymorphic toxin-type HINT domain-containing protein [Streptomyces sp. NPDC051051]|uniref:polymorphic toxin-type HINT domain-containing protein n=1 Tax=Streptomyces sp. NPDC051051 TaxID=3155666 RepID=UPI0034149D2B
MVPTEEELRARPYSGDESYSMLVVRWAEGQCMMDPASDFCAAAHNLGWIRPSSDLLLTLLGVDDIAACAHGSVSGCLWTAAGYLPFGKIAVAAKLLGKGRKSADVGVELGSCLVPHSFVQGTEVLLADGTAKPIEDVEVGDEVVVTDPVSGETTTREVVDTIVTEDDKHFVGLTVTADLLDLADGASVTATTTHPFWSPSRRAWIDAGDLEPGMTLRTDKGATVTIAGTRHFTEHQITYDLTVADIHTYYVLAGETPVLVHNNNCDVAGRGLWQLTKEGSTKLLKGGPFKTTFYKSASDGTWWTPDVTGHGQSAFKVYRETSKGLEWISDADKYGNYMPDKWKGDTGKFIPMNKLRGVKG